MMKGKVLEKNLCRVPAPRTNVNRLRRTMKAPVTLKLNSGSHAAKKCKCLLSVPFIQ